MWLEIKILRNEEFQTLYFKTFVNCSRRHAIPKKQYNLMDMKLHFIYGNFVVGSVFLDQIKNILLQSYYNDLGKETVFQIFFYSYVSENLGNYNLRSQKIQLQKLYKLNCSSTFISKSVHHADGAKKVARVSRIQRQNIPGTSVSKTRKYCSKTNGSSTNLLLWMEEHWVQEDENASNSNSCYSCRWL